MVGTLPSNGPRPSSTSYHQTKPYKDMKEWNKKNWILFAILATVGLTVLSTVIMFSARLWWSAILPVAAIGYGVYQFIKKYLPLTK